MNVITYPPVIIKWVDITTLSGWISQDELDTFICDHEENIVYQAGFLYEEDENFITLLNSYFIAKDLLGDATKIPKVCVLETIRLIDFKEVINVSKKD